MKNLDFASTSRVEFIRLIDAPSAAKQFVIDCAYISLGLVIAAAVIYVGS